MGSKLVMNARQKTFAVALSRQMAPAAHILAYCIMDGEVIMDSIAFFVRDTNLMQVSLSQLINCNVMLFYVLRNALLDD